MGIFQAIVDLVTSATNYLYYITEVIGIPSYALAIILLTLLLKLALFPLTQKQMKSMRSMQRLQPKLKEIQEKYKQKDPKKMQELTMQMYKDNNVNPLAGCLPLLIQMPILIALFKALLEFDFKDPEHAGFLWITNLSHTDPFYVLPVLAGVTTFMQAKLTTSMADQTQRMLLYLMPVFIIWISSTVPSGLVLYWIVFNLAGFAQQYYVNQQPTPDIKEVVPGSEEKSRRKSRKNS